MYSYSNCPLCNHSTFKPFLSCKDHLVSKETFHIVCCEKCDFKFTNPIPDASSIKNYYESPDYISHSDSNKGLISKLYHLVRTYTLKSKLKLVSSFVSRGTILDYGCGTGKFLEVCRQNGWKVIGVEPDKGARNIARTNGKLIFENNAGITQGTMADVITLWHVLEHIHEVNETIEFLKSRLNSQGKLIIAVPNNLSHDAKHYGAHWAAYDLPRHLYHFEPKTLTALFQKHGFDLEQTLPMKFDSYYVSLLSERYKTGSTAYFKAFWQGFLSNMKAGDKNGYSSLIYVFRRR